MGGGAAFGVSVAAASVAGTSVAFSRAVAGVDVVAAVTVDAVVGCRL